MYRFFVEKSNILEDSIVVEGSDVNHIKNVLRMKVGETILLSDGEDKEYTCKIRSLDEQQVVAAIEDISSFSRELPINVTLFQALPKGDKMETIIQKMVELGASSIVPVRTKRCVVKLDDKKASKKVERWNAISLSAAKQAKRGVIPEVKNVMDFGLAIKEAEKMDYVIIPYEEAENMAYTREVLAKIEPGMNVAVFIGPEGGFAESEVEAVKNIGGAPITLGKRILRTETAGMTVMSILMYMFED